MKAKVAESLSRFFYDCAKASFAVLIIGALIRKPFPISDLIMGMGVTLTLLIFAVTIQIWMGGEAENA